MDPKYRYSCLGYYDRVLRFYKKVISAHDGIPYKPEHMTFDAGEAQDNILVFFIFCHHIKDWIKNDPLVDPNAKDKVEGFIENNPCLGFCADIANGTKHFKLDRPTKSKLRPRFTRAQRSIIYNKVLTTEILNSPESSNVVVKEFSYLSTDNGEIEVFELASECINKWKEFIKESIYEEEATKVP